MVRVTAIQFSIAGSIPTIGKLFASGKPFFRFDCQSKVVGSNPRPRKIFFSTFEMAFCDFCFINYYV